MGGTQTTTTRALIVLVLSSLMVGAMALAPARAVSGGDDLEEVRATVTGTFDYKIGLLAGHRDETDNPDRAAVYQAGIDQLASVRDTQVAAAPTTDELWALKDQAHAIYHQTVDDAEQVAKTPAEELAAAKQKAKRTIDTKIGKLRSWIEGCDDPNAIAIVDAGIARLDALRPQVEAATTPSDAHALKDQAHAIYHETIDAAEGAKADQPKQEDPKPEPEEKTAAEKAAEALAAARRTTLTAIARKAAILRSAAAAARIPAVVDVYETAAADVEGLTPNAKEATTTAALEDIRTRVDGIYDAAKEEARSIRDGSEDADPENTLGSYLDRLVDYVTSTTAAAAGTADVSPDTFDRLEAARDTVVARVDAVREVADSGRGLEDRWNDLDDAMRDYRLALVRHYIALGEPAVVAGLKIPG